MGFCPGCSSSSILPATRTPFWAPLTDWMGRPSSPPMSRPLLSAAVLGYSWRESPPASSSDGLNVTDRIQLRSLYPVA